MKCHVTCAGFPAAIEKVLQKTVTRFCHSEAQAKNLSSTTKFRMTNVCAVSDAEMTRMNRQFRQKNKTTDVLTFVYADMVEIYISQAVARKQARERKVTLTQECQRLLVHGLCHALGMDHHTRDDFKEMRRREFEVLVQC